MVRWRREKGGLAHSGGVAWDAVWLLGAFFGAAALWGAALSGCTRPAADVNTSPAAEVVKNAEAAKIADAAKSIEAATVAEAVVTTPEATTLPAATAPEAAKSADAVTLAEAAKSTEAAKADATKPDKSAKTTPKQPGPSELATPAWLFQTTRPLSVPGAEASNEAEMRPYTEVIPGSDVKFEMVPIKGGKFLMGSPANEPGRQGTEGPQREVEVDAFWMGKHEVTWDEYELWCLDLDILRRKALNQQATENDRVADAIARPTKPYTDMTFGMGKDGYPAICMTQLAAKMYCKWLSAKTGRYYRLPTEAEWEYACRAGTTTAYSFGDDPEKLGEYAWYFDNSEDKYQRVGKKKPNPWGLHDMHGNVAEWVLDQQLPDGYKSLLGQPDKNPLVIPTKEYDRVVRGGSWTDDPPALRSAARRVSNKNWKKQDPQIPQSIWYLTDADFVGFRVVRPLRAPTPEEAKKYEIDDFQLHEMEEYSKAMAGRQ
jgi:formylglycine-generating enzyme required for sulfatase activity